MIRRAILGLAFGLAASCAYAQTAPSPADVGISKGTPDVFKLKGQDNAWTPFGSVDPSTHIFIPGTNGNIAPNDCVKWGPGLTSAGVACNSVTGGATPANQLTIYTSHSGLVANVTTPTEAWTVMQQGFYAPGDGGDATYQWSLTSYCPAARPGSPTAADGVVCVFAHRTEPWRGWTLSSANCPELASMFVRLGCSRELMTIPPICPLFCSPAAIRSAAVIWCAFPGSRPIRALSTIFLRLWIGQK